MVGPSENGKWQLIYNWLKIGTFQEIFDKIYFIYQHSQPLYDVMQKETENLEFVRGVNFEFIDSLKNNGTKYLLLFDYSYEEICISKAFDDIATAWRHRGSSTIYIKRNLFHQSKLGRDVELQNTHIVLFTSPRDVMQVTTLSTQLVLGSELVDGIEIQRIFPLVICCLICRHAQTTDYVILQTPDPFRQIFLSRTG